MPSVGERLKAEREGRQTSIDEMATATGIGRSYLEALERDEIRELPGKAFGKLYIRAYAEVLQFDPQPWIEAYERERRLDPDGPDEPPPPPPARPRAVEAALTQWQETKMKERHEPEDEPEVEPVPAPIEQEPIAAAPPPARRRGLRFVTATAAGVAVIAAAAYLMSSRKPVEQPAPVAPPIELPKPTTPPAPAPPPLPAPVKPVAVPAFDGTLTVTESGVGLRVVNLRLEGESDHFPVGERVCFATRVLGGARGVVIRHVWIFEGKIEQAIPLRLGGSDWRTHSNKTILGKGSWAVEARDGKGRVVARATFSSGEKP